MKKIGYLLLCLLSITGFAQSKVEQEVLDFEKKRINATLNSDVSALQEMLADDLVRVHSSGKKQNKQQYIDDHTQKRVKYQKISLEESAVRVYGNVAVTNGRAVYEAVSVKDGSIVVSNLYHTCVYRKSKWQVIAWQTTKIP